MNICMAQINTLVGDIRGNLSRVLEVCADQHDKGAHLVIFPELTLTGYPPEDLLLRSDLISRTADALEALCVVCPLSWRWWWVIRGAMARIYLTARASFLVAS